MSREELYERARKNSVGEEKRVRFVRMDINKFRNKIKRSFITGAAIGMLGISVISAGAEKITTTLEQNQIVSTYITTGAQLVHDNMKRTSNNKYYYYENVDIGVALANDPENFDINLYGAYCAYDYDVIKQLNTVVSIYNMKQGTEGNFVDYYTERGFVKEDGSFDAKAYRKAMEELIIKTDNVRQAEETLAEAKGK